MKNITDNRIRKSQTVSKVLNKTKSIALLALLIPSLIGFSATVPTQNAEAVKCTDPHCYAFERYTTTSTSGNKYNTIVSNLSVPNYCVNIAVVTHWLVFSNLDWIESGFTVGPLQGVCQSTEKAYYAFATGGGSFYQEFNIGSVAIGSNQYFEISDTDKDKFWDVWWNTSNVAHIQMTASFTTRTDVGEESDVNNPGSSTIPKTHMFNVQRFVGTPGSWQAWNSGTLGQDSTQGYWIVNCTPNYNHVHVGTGTVGDCTGTH